MPKIKRKPPRFGATGNEKTEWEAKSLCCGGNSSKDITLDLRVFALIQTINYHKQFERGNAQ
jgi:hypothetical protein